MKGDKNGEITIEEDINGNFENDISLYDDEDKTNLHGYIKMSGGCGDKIQLEDPSKRELLVRIVIQVVGQVSN